MYMYGTLYCISINIAYVYVVGAAVYRTVENESAVDLNDSMVTPAATYSLFDGPYIAQHFCILK